MHLQRINHSGFVATLGLDALVHDLVPIFARQYLKDGQQRNGERVEVGGWRAVGQIELPAKQLHAQQCEYQYEQEEQEQQGYNRAH